MCEQLTSCGIKMCETPELAIHTTNSHAITWAALNLESPQTAHHATPWREIEWLEGDVLPSIRWREEDDAGARDLLLAWVLERWQTREIFIEHCCANATTIDASGCTRLTRLNGPNATTIYTSGCTRLTRLNGPNATTIDARNCTKLTRLNGPNATTIDASGCTQLTQLIKFNGQTPK